MVGASLITDKVKQLVRMRGPVIPSQISKEIGTNILMASAILSELSSHGDVKISSVKVGGTPLYYVAGQEHKLQNYTASLHPRVKEVFEKLKAAGVLEDVALDPATRAALRELKDFAKPLDVSTGQGEAELFWKWYLLSNEAAETEIKKLMGLNEPEPQQMQQPPQPQAQQQQLKREEPVLQIPAQETPQVQSTLRSNQQSPAAAAQQKSAPKPRQPSAQNSEFSKAVNSFLSENDIEILPETVSEKGDEFVVLLPSPVGKLKYYCVARNKKTCTDSDISSALVQGQLKKMPVLLITKGELSKKAQELLSKDVGSIVVKKM